MIIGDLEEELEYLFVQGKKKKNTLFGGPDMRDFSSKGSKNQLKKNTIRAQIKFTPDPINIRKRNPNCYSDMVTSSRLSSHLRLNSYSHMEPRITGKI